MTPDNTFLTAVKTLAARDDQFGARLLDSPAEAIEAEFGVPVPPDVTVLVTRGQPSQYHIDLRPRDDRRPRTSTQEPAFGASYGWT
ncbi:MAG: hypothetical protein HKP61_13095 [Dactylosporangium sp.]|nr:hypothetical protein [Dactylosporangium sp.]NNJ61852.1 hypothetical protein [Dactylosporangium sp.]